MIPASKTERTKEKTHISIRLFLLLLVYKDMYHYPRKFCEPFWFIIKFLQSLAGARKCFQTDLKLCWAWDPTKPQVASMAQQQVLNNMSLTKCGFEHDGFPHPSLTFQLFYHIVSFQQGSSPHSTMTSLKILLNLFITLASYLMRVGQQVEFCSIDSPHLWQYFFCTSLVFTAIVGPSCHILCLPLPPPPPLPNVDHTKGGVQRNQSSWHL